MLHTIPFNTQISFFLSLSVFMSFALTHTHTQLFSFSHFPFTAYLWDFPLIPSSLHFQQPGCWHHLKAYTFYQLYFLPMSTSIIWLDLTVYLTFFRRNVHCFKHAFIILMKGTWTLFPASIGPKPNQHNGKVTLNKHWCPSRQNKTVVHCGISSFYWMTIITDVTFAALTLIILFSVMMGMDDVMVCIDSFTLNSVCILQMWTTWPLTGWQGTAILWIMSQTKYLRATRKGTHA